MTYFQALILGIIQGITEFLPVSSSTHLTIAKRLMGIEGSDWMVYFDLLCHVGTLFAILIVLWKDVWRILTSIRAISLFTFALLPLIPAYLLLKPLRLMLAPSAGLFLMCTGVLMFLASHPVWQPVRESDSTPRATNQGLKWLDVLWIGAAQSMALLPGISRSGSTISAARLLGWEWKDAARFSFLLSIPTILGGSLLETIRETESLAMVSWGACAVGFAASFGVGLLTIRLLFWMLNRGTLRPFAWYCLVIGAITWIGWR